MGTELHGAGGYRVGDADCNRTADLLKEAHAAGYSHLEEIDERLGTALAACTRGELDQLVADPLPGVAGQSGTGPAGQPGCHRASAPSFPPEAGLAGAAGDGHHRHSACRPHPRLLVLPVAAALGSSSRLRPPGPGWLAAAPLVTGLVPARGSDAASLTRPTPLGVRDLA